MKKNTGGSRMSNGLNGRVGSENARKKSRHNKSQTAYDERGAQSKRQYRLQVGQQSLPVLPIHQRRELGLAQLRQRLAKEQEEADDICTNLKGRQALQVSQPARRTLHIHES